MHPADERKDTSRDCDKGDNNNNNSNNNNINNVNSIDDKLIFAGLDNNFNIYTMP